MKLFKITILLAVTAIISASGWAESNLIKGTRLTYTDYISNAAWSPDGNNIAYTFFMPTPEYPDTVDRSSYYISGTCHEIVMISSSGTTPEVIYKPEPFIVNKDQIDFAFYPKVFNCCFSWDGSEIFFCEYVMDPDRGTNISITWSGTPGGTFGCSILINGLIPTLKAINVNTKEVRVVAEYASSMICSKDGRHIVFKVAENNTFGYTMDSYVSLNTATGQTFLLLSPREGMPASFCISKDGNYFIYSLTTSSVLYKIPIEGGTKESIADLQKRATSLSLSNNDEWLLFETNTNKTDSISYHDGMGYSVSTHKEIYAYNFITGKLVGLFEGLGFDLSPENIDPNSPVNYYTPVFSPDGSKFFCTLTFATVTSTGTAEIRDLFVFDFNVEEYLKTLGEIGVETEPVPDAFAIKGNYPNPFNPSTTIEFTLGKAEKTSLVIYNLAGQRVRELMEDTILTPGIHSILWNGKDDSGKTVSSGIYFARLLSGEKSSVKSMMFVK